MENVGKQTDIKYKRGNISSPKRLSWTRTFRSIASEELKYIFDLITGKEETKK